MESLLALETSSPVLSVAVKRGRGPILETRLGRGSVTPPPHSENLISVIDRLLKKARLSLKDIDVFLVGRGPGSFTGLRIGFASLKGLLAISKKDCYGALSLDMIAHGASDRMEGPLAVCLDARREKIYTRFYTLQNARAKPRGKPSILTFDEFIAHLPREIYVAGDALLRHQEEFKKRADEKIIHFLPESLWYPRASALIYFFEQIKNTRRGGVVSPLHRLKKPADFLPLYPPTQKTPAYGRG